MDAAPRKRQFPSYTVAQLEAAITQYEAGTHPCGDAPEGHVDAMKTEIAARKAGTSTVYKVPQIEGGKPITRVGRM